jgi:single-strand DNA-binding protein
MKKLTITGNLGRDPELRIDASGNKFATFSVGVSVGTKINPRTDWVDVSCNGKLAEIATTYAVCGNKILVEGFPAVAAYLNSENEPVGVQRLYAHTIELLERAPRKTDEGVDEGHSIVTPEVAAPE